MPNARNVESKICTDTLKLLADFWTLQIIESLQRQEMRYCAIQREIGNVNPVTLTNRLQKLEKSGLIKRDEEIEDKISVTYSLTLKGKKALPVLKAIKDFSI